MVKAMPMHRTIQPKIIISKYYQDTHSRTNEEFRLYDYEDGLNAIDWDTMHTPGTEDRYTKNVKMAECLTPLIVPAKLFHCIYVKNEATRAVVKERLQSSGISNTPPYVDIGRWL